MEYHSTIIKTNDSFQNVHIYYPGEFQKLCELRSNQPNKWTPKTAHYKEYLNQPPAYYQDIHLHGFRSIPHAKIWLAVQRNYWLNDLIKKENNCSTFHMLSFKGQISKTEKWLQGQYEIHPEFAL